MNQPNYQITLVHGTFARGALWTQENSRLAQALKAGLDGQVRIDRCEWSGGNSAAAREAGASKLAAHLRGSGEPDPDTRRFVVAHSHGGNVALYALRDPEVARRVSGVVCMATPFLVARPRDLGPKGTTNLITALVLVLLAINHLFVADRMAAAAPWLPGVVSGFIFVWIGTVLLMLLYVRWDRMASGLLEHLRLAELPTERLLILRTTGDEASALLLFFQFLSLLAVRLFHLLQRLHGLLERRFTAWAKRKLALLLAAVIGFLLTLAVLVLLVQVGVGLTAFVTAVVIAVMLLGFVTPLFLLAGWIEPATVMFRLIASLALLPAALILAVCMLPIDWRVALANLLIDVTAEVAPAGAWRIHQLVPLPSDVEGKAAPELAHSAIYEDDRVVRAIVEWIRRGAEAGA